MPPPVGRWIPALLINAALAAVVAAAAPAQPRLSDRAEYEYTGRHGFDANCPNSIYCYRVLVPMLLDRIPADPERRWRAHQWLAHTATGTVVSMAVAPIGSPLLAAVVLQLSYPFAFTAYDPFTADPLVFLIAALTLHCWLLDRWLAFTLIAAIGVFAKETVALIASAPAIAVMFADRPPRLRWWLPAITAWIALLAFHWYMDTYYGWGITKNPAANFSGGSWLALWWRNNPSLARKALMLFSPFGFAWLFAALGYRFATPAIRQLAIGAVLPIAVLIYVQTPERALGNAFFVVVPLAAAFLSRVSPASAWAAVATNGLVTAKIGLSTAWLPSTSILLIPASLSAAWAIASSRRQSA
ncbi:MAG: hypothetical protein ABI983_09800 [Acidobacteriota bacterium]